jgi:dCTP deaminase
MSKLVDWQVKEEIKKGNLVIEPFNPEQLGPNTYDIRLGNIFLEPVVDYTVQPNGKVHELAIDPTEPGTEIKYKEFQGPYLLKPGGFVLAVIKEKIGTHKDLSALIFGRSNISRLGLCISEGPFIDTGFEGYITLEIYNQSPYKIWLKEGWRIGHIAFYKGEQPEVSYDKRPSSKYAGVQVEVRPYGWKQDKEYRK